MFDSMQRFHQTTPLQESHVAIRDDPQKNEKGANLALSFCKTAGHRHSILKAIPGLKIATNRVAKCN